MPERSHPAARVSPEFIPPVASSGTRLRRYQGGVDVPREQRRRTAELIEDFKGLDPKIQGSIIEIIRRLREISPERAEEVARRIGDFFHSVRDAGRSINDLLEEIDGELEKARRQRAQ